MLTGNLLCPNLVRSGEYNKQTIKSWFTIYLFYVISTLDGYIYVQGVPTDTLNSYVSKAICSRQDLP